MKQATGSRFLGILGVSLVLLGLILNQWTVARLLTPDGAIESPRLRGMIWLIDIVCVAFGILLVSLRRRIIERLRRGVNLILFASAFIGSLAVAEALLRLMGLQPWPEGILNPAQIRVDPGDTFSQPDATLGHTLIPGSFVVTLPGGHSFHVTHSEQSTRITNPPRQDSSTDLLQGVWIFGCSFTYGWGVDDEHTYPWLLQASLPRCEVVNYGTSGYSTVQSFLQFREELMQRAPPVVVILAYASFHDARNSLSRSWRKLRSLYPDLSNRQYPYAQIDEEGKLVLATKHVRYNEFPFIRNLVTANLIEELYNRVRTRTDRSNRISQLVISEFHQLARSHGIRMILAGISNDPATSEMLRNVHAEGLETADISVDLSIRSYTNEPYDNHPSPLAHRRYAERLREIVTPSMNDSADASHATLSSFPTGE